MSIDRLGLKSAQTLPEFSVARLKKKNSQLLAPWRRRGSGSGSGTDLHGGAHMHSPIRRERPASARAAFKQIVTIPLPVGCRHDLPLSSPQTAVASLLVDTSAEAAHTCRPHGNVAGRRDGTGVAPTMRRSRF
jgi:hypothetical protein